MKSSSTQDVQNTKKMKLEGRVTKITYEGLKRKDNFEVYKNYELAIEKAGFKILYKGKGNEIRGIYNFLEKINHEYLRGWSDPDICPWFFLSAKTTDNKHFVSLYVHGNEMPIVVLTVIELKEMETYGIYFDFNSAELKSESKATVDEIAKLLKNNPSLKLYVVGHTDNIGGLEYNIELSLKRADAVINELGIEKVRLRVFGVGPLPPVASNRSEEERAKNRRVELIEQ